MKQKISIILLVASLLFLINRSAHALVIYDSFNTGNDIENGVYNFGRTSFSNDRDIGFRFVPNVTTMLDQIEVPIVTLPERNNLRDAVLWLMTENNGQPDSIIESFYFTSPNGPAFNPSSNFPITTLNSSLHPLINEGTPYYLIASDNFGLINRPTVENAFAWEIEDTGLPRKHIIAFRDIPNGIWLVSDSEYSPQARILGSTIPEPASIVLFVTGLTGAFLRQRIRIG